MIVAGFSEGIVSVYKEDKKYKTEDEYVLSNIAKIKVSSDRVTKILINKKKGQMYAVLRSNKLCIIDMATWTSKDSVKIGSGPILAIHLDESYEFGISTTEDGKMHVIDLSGDKPVVTNTIAITTKGKISCMDADIDSGKIILACYETGELFVVDVEFPFTAVEPDLRRSPNSESWRLKRGTSSPDASRYGRRGKRSTWATWTELSTCTR